MEFIYILIIIFILLFLLYNYQKHNQSQIKYGFIDVGASHGLNELPNPWKKNDINKYLSFEPTDLEVDTDKDIPHTNYKKAVSDITGKQKFYTCKVKEGSSLKKQNFNYIKNNYDQLVKTRGNDKGYHKTWFDRSKIVSEEYIDCIKLDDVLTELNAFDQYDILKIDVQGAEYEVLKGANKWVTEYGKGIHLELFDIPMYEDIRLNHEVKEYLENLDYELIWKSEPFGTFSAARDYFFINKKRGDKYLINKYKIKN